MAAGWNARSERIASKASRTLTGSDVIPDGTLGIHSAEGAARVDALVIVANLGGRTFRVFNAFGTTAVRIRIAFIARTASTNSSEASLSTIGV